MEDTHLLKSVFKTILIVVLLVAFCDFVGSTIFGCYTHEQTHRWHIVCREEAQVVLDEVYYDCWKPDTFDRRHTICYDRPHSDPASLAIDLTYSGCLAEEMPANSVGR